MGKRTERIKKSSREAKEAGEAVKGGFLFGGSLNPVLGIPSVNSGPISIHSAGYIAKYTCFLLLFGTLPLSSPFFVSTTRESASSVSLARAGCCTAWWRRCLTCFALRRVYTRHVQRSTDLRRSSVEGPPFAPPCMNTRAGRGY